MKTRIHKETKDENKRQRQEILFAVIVFGITLLVGQITLAIQNNSLYENNITEHETSFIAGEWVVNGTCNN